VSKEKGAGVDYLMGTTIEVPRPAVVAAKIAEIAESFTATNDLT